MNRVEFNQTSNIFINTGIIGLYHYLRKYKRREAKDFDCTLEPNKLIVESDDILKLLEEVYYFMGKYIYDLSSKKQLEKMENVYYDVKNNKFHKFPKMKTYGLAALLTNDAQGTTIAKENSPKIKDLDNNHPEIAKKIRAYFIENGLKLAKKAYLNEPYKKITTLELNNKYWKKGRKRCPLTGEKFELLVEGKNISPFIGSMRTFNTCLHSSDISISQKAIYIARFSPVFGMYFYLNGYNSFINTFFKSNNLQETYDIYESDFFYDKDVMKNWKFPFHQNVKLHQFRLKNKDDESNQDEISTDAYSATEVTFLILLTFYKRKLGDKFDAGIMEEKDDDILKILNLGNKSLSLITFRADSFASTLRPNFYEEFTNAKFIIKLIHRLETNQEKYIPIQEIWFGLLLKTSQSKATKNFDNKMRLQRHIRTACLTHIFKGQSILSLIEHLFQKSYFQLSNNNFPGYRRYDLILEFLIIYESTLNIMEESLQKRAIGLGKSIGQAILNYDNAKTEVERKANAKNGRKYLIGLHKARTIEHFRDNLIRIQRKYNVSIANEILEKLNEKNYVAIKQYTQIGALNQLNIVMSQKKDSNTKN